MAAVLLAALVAITAIDLQYQIIPDVISLPGILAGCLANVATGRVPWVDSLLGIVVGGGVCSWLSSSRAAAEWAGGI